MIKIHFILTKKEAASEELNKKENSLEVEN